MDICTYILGMYNKSLRLTYFERFRNTERQYIFVYLN